MQQLFHMRGADGSDYDVPESEVANFRKAVPDAVGVSGFRDKGGDAYDVPDSERENFQKAMPDAQPVHSFRTDDGRDFEATREQLSKFADDVLFGERADPDSAWKSAGFPELKGSRKDGASSSDASMMAAIVQSGGMRGLLSDRARKLLDERDREAGGAAGAGERLAPPEPGAVAAVQSGYPLDNDETDPFGSWRRSLTDAEFESQATGQNPISTGVVEGMTKTPGGLSYGVKKNVAPYVRSFLTAPMRLMGHAIMSGAPMSPTITGGATFNPPKESAEPFMQGSREIDAALTPTKEEEDAQGAVGQFVGTVEEKAQTIGAFALALHNLGRGAGNTLMSAEAGNETYLSLYETGVRSGLPEDEAKKYAAGGSAVATLGTAAMGWLSIPKFMKMGVPEIEAGVAMNGYKDLLNAAMVGNVKRYLVNAAVASAYQGGIMGAESLLETPFEQKAQGKGVDWAEAWWNAGKSAAEGFGVGMFMHGLSFADYRRGVRAGIEAEARRAASTEDGRTAWRMMFPEGVRNVVEKRVAGKDISRSDIERAGFPEMTKVERNAVADAYVEDMAKFAAENAERLRAESELRKPAEPVVGPAPYDQPAEPGKGEVEPEPAKAPERPVEPVKPPEKPVETQPAPVEPPRQPVETQKNGPVGARPPEGTITPAEPAEAPQAAQPEESAASTEVASLAERRKELQDKYDANLDENGNPQDAETAHALERELDKIDSRLGEIEAANPGTLPQDLKAVARMPKSEAKEVKVQEAAGNSAQVPAEAKKPTELPMDDHGQVIGEVGDSIELENGMKATVTRRKNGGRKWTITQGKRWTTDGGKTWHDGLKPGDRFTDEDFDAPDKVPANVHFGHQKNDSGIWEVEYINKDGSYELKPVPAKSDEATYREEYRRRKEMSARMDELAKEWAERTGNKPLDANFGDPKRVGEEYARLRKELNGVQPNLLDDLAKRHGADWAVEQERAVDGEAPAEPAEPTQQPKPVNKGKGITAESIAKERDERIAKVPEEDRGFALVQLAAYDAANLLRSTDAEYRERLGLKPKADDSAKRAASYGWRDVSGEKVAVGDYIYLSNGVYGEKGVVQKIDAHYYYVRNPLEKDASVGATKVPRGKGAVLALFRKTEQIPVKTETGGNKGDAAQQLSAMSDEDIEKAFAEALGEKEAAAEEAPPAPVPAPKPVNKGKGKVPAKTENAETVPAAKSLVWDSVTPERSRFLSGAITDPAHINAIHELDREHDILEVVDPPNVNNFGTMYVDVIERKGGRVVASRYYVDSSYKGDTYHRVVRGLQGGELSETKLQDWHFDTLRGKRDEWLNKEAQPATAPVNKGKGVPRPVREDSSSREVQAIAQQFGGDEAASSAVAALHNLFGASDAAKSRAKDLGMAAKPADNFDENVYNTARPHFQALLDGVVKSGRGVNDFIKAVADNFGAGALPYLKRFAADMRKGPANGQQGTEGNRDGQRGGPDAADGLGASEAGTPVAADGAGGPEPAAGGAGTERGVRPGPADGQGGGGRDGVRPDGQLAGHEAAGGGGGAARGPVGNGLVPKDAGTGADAGQPSVVRAPNGNIDTRKSPPVRLTASKRTQINAQAAQLAEKPVGTLTDAEIEVLRQFTGAGGLGYRGKSSAQQKAALNQHFTDYSVVDAMWSALEKAGVPMENVLEPSAGSGNFPGRRPEKNWTLVELEPTTAKVLKHLFPGAKVMQGSYEDVKLEGLDLAISNVPFLEQRHHPDRPDIKNLHDYFFAKAIDQVKPNGVVAFITSAGTMNDADKHIRQELVDKGDVIGAFRLPRGMFKANAGTEVTTDMIFIQRRPDGVPARPENAERNGAFVESVEHIAADGVSKMRISSYYEKYPEGLLGDLREEKDKMYGGRPKLELMPSDATDLSQVKIDYKPYPVAGEPPSAPSEPAPQSKYPHDVAGLDAAGVKYELSDGNGTYAQNIRMYDGVPHAAADEFTLEGYEEGTHKAKVFEPVGGEIGKKITELQHILDDANAYQGGDEAASRRGLEAIADYEKRFGKLPGSDKALKKYFKDHGEQHYLMELTAAANPDAAVWREKVRHEGSGKKQADESSSLIDQALASEDAHGEIDMGSDRCKVSPSDFRDLLESGYSLTGVGTGGKPILQNNVLFESGNIYAKIDFQKKLKAAQSKMAAIIDRQIERLEKALPTPKVFDAIPFNGSEDWVMPSLMESGIHVVEDMSDAGIREFHVTCPSLLTNDEAAILSRHMSGRKLLDKKDDESDEMYLRREREAESSLTDIYAKVRGRIAEDPERVHKIEKAFNERFNGYVKPDFSKAEYLIADTVKHFADAGFPLRPNQKRWVTQALIEGTGINAHDVGGGKTMAALALAHALKARGVAKKPMFVVPAKTINTSWLNSKNGAQILFPGAKIVNLNNLPAETRARQLFELANSNADFVFISHEGFESIQLPPDAEAAALNEFANSLIDATGDRREAMERDRLEAYIAQVAKEERDTRLTFDKLGVDCIIVDEAHNYKNVGVSAPMERQGLGKRFTVKKAEERGKPMSIMSHRAHDFRFKADWISDHNNGRNVFLLTATPTPNKPIELYTMLRHLGRRVFEEYGINNDRDFAHMFFSTGLRPVISTSGGTKNKEMITGLTNVYALKDIMGRYIDRIPMEVFAQHGIRLPKEKVEIRFVDMSSDMEMVQNEIIDRVREASGGGWDKPQKGADTVIGAFMNGRDAAVSPYVYGGPHAHVSVADRSHDPRTDKIEYAVQYATHEVARGMKDGEDPRCVLIFTDVMGGKDGKPSVPEDIKESLIRRGFDPKEIAIVTGSVITNPKTGREIQASGKKAIEMKGELADLFAPKKTDPKTGRPEKPKVKVMIGSTSSIGEGLNLDTWTSLAIHLDVPLTPGAIRQRRGRNIRFNNEHDEAKTVFLMTRGSFDQLSYGLVAKKQGWNSAIWDDHTGDTIPVDDDAAGGGINPRQIIIECERDPVRKQQMRVEFDMEARQNAIDQAREAVQSFADRISTQKIKAGLAQNRADDRSVLISKSLREKAEIESKLPTIEKEIETARADLAEDAPEQAKELAGLIEKAAEAKDALASAKDAVHAASIKDLRAAEAALDEAKKANGAAKEAVTQYIESLPKELQPFARVYRNKVAELAKAKDEIATREASVEWGKGIITNAERDVKAANARAAELEEQSEEARQALKDAIEARDALGREWYDDYGTNNQRFKFEKASLAAEMEARNSEEDSLDWMDENQTLDAMPAPASTGSRPLNRGKLPGARPFGASGTAKPKQTTSKSDIFRLARELFPEIKITNKGTYHRRGVLGWLEVENRVIRTIDPRGVGELCHELGHAVSRLGARVKMPKDARTEFISLGIDLYGAKRPAGGYAAEGFAEFTRGFLCDYDLAQDYPNAHKWFFEDFGGANEEFVERIYRLRDKIMEYVNMAPEHAIRAKWDHSRPMSPSELPFIAKLRRYDFKTKWVDSNWPIMRAMKRLSVDYNFHDRAKTPAERADLILNHPYMLATFFQGSALRFAEGDALNCTTDLYGDPTGASLQEILSPIVALGGESVKEFWDFAVAMRGADYLKRGMEFGNTREELAATIRAHRSKPGFRKALDDITDWSHRALHLLVDAGAITPDEYQQIVDANPVYVTIKRAFEEGEINAARQKAGKRGLFARKGSSRDIERPVVALIEMAAKIRAQAQQAKITQSLVDMYDRAKASGAKDLNTFMVEVPNPIRRQVVWADKVKEQIGDILRARSSLTEAEIKQLVKDTWTEELSVFTTGKYRGKDNIFTVTDRTGKLRSFELFDPTVRDLMLGYGKPPELTTAGRAKQVVANVIRMGATVLNGGFSLVANPIRDAATGFHMSQYGTQVPMVSTVVGMVERLFSADAAKTYLRLGGEMGRIYNGGQHAAAKAIAEQAEASNWFARQWKKGIFQLVGDLFSTPEMGPRIEQARMAQNFWRGQGVGDTAANFLARLLGGDLTIDFGRAGTSARRLNSVLLFFNAACRELDQLARASGLADPLPWQDPGNAQPDPSIKDAKERNEDFARKARRNMAKRFWSRGAAMTLFALAAYLLNNDNDKKMRRWRELRPEYKWNNTVVDFGDGDGEAPAIRLPVPFLDGLMFQSMPIAILESYRTGDTTPVNEVAGLMAEQLPFSPSLGGKSWYHKLRGLIPTYAQPATDVWANENWAGNEIVPERMQRMDKRDQYSPTTTEFAKRMGEMLNTSPAQVEFLFDQYTGGMVMNAIRAVESSTAKRGSVGVNGDYSKLPIIGKLFLAPYSSSRVPGVFYDALGDLTARHNGGRVTPEELGRLKAMEDVHAKVLSENSQLRREVLGRDDITADEAKRLTDGYAKDTIEVIRTFNDWAKDHDFRAEGIRAAAVTLSNPGATDGAIERDRKILSGVDLAEAQAQLRIYGKAKGWSRDTVNKRLRFLANRW